jgi:hypothetical protein
MAKVLLITTPAAGVAFHVKRVLNTLGIASDVMYAITSTQYALLEPASGVSSAFNPTTSAMRDFLRRYNAIFVIVPLAADDTSTTLFNPIVNTWMQSWNAPEDPPVFSFGYNFNTRASLSLPSDFPIIRADTANNTTIANTMWRWETGIFQTVGGLRTRIGTRVRLLRENRVRLHPQRQLLLGERVRRLSGEHRSIGRAIASYWRFPISPTRIV